MTFKYKLFAKLTALSAALFFLNGCESLEKVGTWIGEQYDKYDARMEAIPTPIDGKILEMKEAARNVAEAIFEAKIILAKAQAHADEVEKLEAGLATLKSSPTEDVSAISTALNDTKELNVDNKAEIDLERKKMNAQERAAIRQILITIPHKILITFDIHGDIGIIQKPYNDKLRKEREIRRERKDSKFSLMSDQERDMIYAMNHKSFKLLALYKFLWNASGAVYSLIEYSLEQGDISSEEKDLLNAQMAELESNKVDPNTIEEMGEIRPEGVE